ncbi:hypothetical protein ACJMK2_026230, partial [Sinanodonta woodiana]
AKKELQERMQDGSYLARKRKLHFTLDTQNKRPRAPPQPAASKMRSPICSPVK